MTKIKPTAFITYKGYLKHANDPKLVEYSSPEPLYDEDALKKALTTLKAECEQAAKEWAMQYVEVDHAPHGIDVEIQKYVDVVTILNNLTTETL